jgi:DNA-binding Lrp family transcriptional regulator
MKIFMLLGDSASELLFDDLNSRIVRELLFSEYAVSELSRKLRVPQLKIWRRVQKLVDAKVLEVVRVEKAQNLEKKIYRAAAAKFVPRQFLDLKPANKSLAKAFNTYLEIQRQLMSGMARFSEIPEGANPVDYAIYASSKSFCQIFRDPDVKNKVERLEREISEFEENQSPSSTLR